MGSTSEKIKIPIARLKIKCVLYENNEDSEGAELGFEDQKILGHIMESYEFGRTLGKGRRLTSQGLPV